jgi:hypothetical protein
MENVGILKIMVAVPVGEIVGVREATNKASGVGVSEGVVLTAVPVDAAA